jgi:hypothetical protein
MGPPHIIKQATTNPVTKIMEKLLVWYIFSSLSLDPNLKYAVSIPWVTITFKNGMNEYRIACSP